MTLLRKHVKEILNLYNYFNMAIIVNEKGIVEYFYNNRPDINSISERDILGRCVLESCVNLEEETSILFHVLRTGKPVNNMFQELVNSKGDVIYCYCSTMPIKDGETIIGAVEVAKYVDIRTSVRTVGKSSISLSTVDSREGQTLYRISDIKGSSKGMKRLRHKVECVANTDSTVLICGETGTGKELIAESIHSCGKRRDKQFVSQNCAAIPPGLLEGLLFGTEKGGYTGAESRRGLIEAAAGGTLFLDEINTMDIDTQSKLLKAIEEKKIMRVGGMVTIPVDVRIVAAVNVDPKTCVRKKQLREDLYYRLRVVELKIPPLRERREDIPELVDYYIKYYNHRMGKYIDGLSEDLAKTFREYSWPGNVRELKNAIESGFNMAVTPILEPRDMAAFFRRGREEAKNDDFHTAAVVPLKKLLQEKEKEIVERTYAASKNISEAARKLNLSRQGLTKKLNEYGCLTK